MKELLGDSPLIQKARQGRRMTHVAVAILVVVLAVLMSIPFLLLTLPMGAWLGSLGEKPLFSGIRGALTLWSSYLPMALVIFAWVRWFEKRPVASLGLGCKGAFKNFLMGGLIGFLMLSMAVAGMLLSGYSRFTTGEPALTGWSAVGGVLVMLAGFAVQATTEEIVFRGWLLPVFSARYNAWVGIVVSSVLFSLAHFLNPGIDTMAVINLMLFGVFMALWALMEGGLWGISAWHIFWNWAQGNVFGLQVSGTVSEGGSLLQIESAGPTWLAGSEFGPEVTIFTTILLLAGIAVLLVLKKRQSLAGLEETRPGAET